MENSLLYKYVTMDRLKKILVDHKMRFTQPSAFNDPFELVPLLLVPKGAVPQGQRNYEFSLSAPRRPIDIDTKGAEDRCSDDHSRDLRESLDREVGFLSLSRTWKSLSMWAHYADNYAGAVIEFDGSHEFLSGRLMFTTRMTAQFGIWSYTGASGFRLPKCAINQPSGNTKRKCGLRGVYRIVS